LALVGKARIASDDEQPADPGQRSGDLLNHAVGEIFLRGIAAQIEEWQDRERRLLRKWQTRLGSRLRDSKRPLRMHQPIAAPRDGYDATFPVLVLLEQLAQCSDVDLKIVLLDDGPGPNPRDQLVFANDGAAGRGQDAKDVERPAAEPHGFAVAT
jgi:hypothetical protein